VSGHCPQCGTYHEEDDDRVCGKCNIIDRLTRENADLRAKLAAAEKALDDQAEAVRVLAHEISEWRLAHVCSPVSLIDAPIIRARKRTASNPTAAAAVKEAGGG
jgi:hypothetical protein